MTVRILFRKDGLESEPMKEVKKSFSDFVFIYLATIIALPLMLVSEAFQGRYLGVSNYGMVSLLLSFISFIYFFSFSWMNYSLIRFGKEELEKENHMRSVNTSFLIIHFFLIFITLIIYFIFEKQILEFFKIQQNNLYRVIIISGFLIMLFKNYIFQSLKTVKHLKLQSLLDRIVPKIIILVLILFLAFVIKEFTVIHILIVFISADLLVSVSGIFFIKKEYFFPFRADKEILKKMLIFSLPLFFGVWSNYIIDWIDLYAIKYFLTMNDVGIYSVAYKLFNAGKYIFSSGIVTVTVPIVILFNTRKETDKIKIYIRRLTPQIAFIGFIVLSVVVFFIDYIIALIYGDKFAPSALPLKILIASQVFGVVNYMLTSILIAYNKTRFLSVLGVILALLNIGGDIVLIPLIGYIGAAITTMFIYSVNAIIIQFYLNRKFDIRRNISFLFAVMLYLVVLVNILVTSFPVRGIITFCMILLTILASRYFYLFKSSDMEIFNNISIPAFIRKTMGWIIQLLSRN